MTTELTDQERSSIEERITCLYHNLQAEAMKLNADGVLAFCSDASNLGAMADGEWFPTMASIAARLRENYSRQERLEEEVNDLRAVALAPDAALLIVDKAFTFYGKDSSIHTSAIVQTYVGAEVDGEWKFIHFHVSTPHRPE